MLHHLYLAPHLDDAVYSCGGLIAEQTARGEAVTCLTIFAGDPPAGELSAFARGLHRRWETPVEAVDVRREEDREACITLGARYVHLNFPDAIYRRGPLGEALYASEEAIIGDVHVSDEDTLQCIKANLAGACEAMDRVYCPLGLGGHVDHVLVRQAAELLERDLWYYLDFPYAARGRPLPPGFDLPVAQKIVYLLDENSIQLWVRAILSYKSQVSTFWEGAGQLERELSAFISDVGGVRLYVHHQEQVTDEL